MASARLHAARPGWVAAKPMREGYVSIRNHYLTAVTCPGLECLIGWEQATAWTVVTVEVTGMRLPSREWREAVGDRFVAVDIRQRMVVLFSPGRKVCCCE